MATKTKKTSKLREFHVYRYWPVEYRSIAVVQARSPEEAARLGLEDDDYDDQESCDGSDGPTEIGRIVEITPDGGEVEHPVPAGDEETVTFTRAQAAALLSGVSVALEANGGGCPDSVRESLLSAVETLNEAFDFGL